MRMWIHVATIRTPSMACSRESLLYQTDFIERFDSVQLRLKSLQPNYMFCQWPQTSRLVQTHARRWTAFTHVASCADNMSSAISWLHHMQTIPEGNARVVEYCGLAPTAPRVVATEAPSIPRSASKDGRAFVPKRGASYLKKWDTKVG